MIAYQLTHNRHHQHRSCQIIHIGRNQKSDECEWPKESLTTTHAQPLDEGIEYTIMEHHLQDGICSNQEENDRTSLDDIMSHQVLRHKTAHRQTLYLVWSLISGILLRENAYEKGLTYAYVGRKLKKREYRSLWIQRINAAARLEGMSYSQLMGAIHKAGIEINRKTLANLAMNNPEAFKAIVDKVK